MITSLAVMGAMLGTSHAIIVAAEEPKQTAVSTCSDEFLRRAVQVASGHGRDFELAAFQIGRQRCDCRYDLKANTKSCEASVTSEAEAVTEEE